NREKLRQRRTRPLPSSVGGTSDDSGLPLSSNGRGTAHDPPHPMGGVTPADPSHPVGGVSPDPSHFMQQPLPSNGSRPRKPILRNSARFSMRRPIPKSRVLLMVVSVRSASRSLWYCLIRDSL